MNLTWAVHAYAWTSHWTNGDLAIIDRAHTMRAATCVWREMAESSDALVGGGLRYLRGLAAAHRP